MLTARRKSDGTTVTAYFASKADAPFACLDCREEVILKIGRNKINHFAHANPVACKFSQGESELHRRCKIEIYEALQKQPNVRDATVELPLGPMRPDVFAIINGTPVAIEVQISSLSVETIMQRTIEYGRNGIYVLWLLQWTPQLDRLRFAPRRWERWIHVAYFGRVYYWLEGLTVVSYRFEANFKTIPRKTWYSEGGQRMNAGGYSRKSKRYRTAVRGSTLNLVTDFAPMQRYWWEGNGLKVPDAKLYTQS